MLNERNILAKCKNNFLINAKLIFQDLENVYLLLDLLTGKDLRFHLCYYRNFSNEKTRIFSVRIALGLKTISQKSFIPQEGELENIIFNEKDNISITDFGIAKKFNPENSKKKKHRENLAYGFGDHASNES